MNNFGVLYRYECKKLFGRKIVWIGSALCAAAIIVFLCVPFMGSYYAEGEPVDTHLNMYRTGRRYSQALSGRRIDQELLEETIGAYRRIPYTKELRYSLTEEYQQYARPYSAIFNFIVGTTDMQTSEVILSWQPDEADLYEKRKIWLESVWKELGLSEGEIGFWRMREAQIETPFVYQHHEAYRTLISCFQTVSLSVLLLTAVCLSGMFSEEHTRRTDQIILCSPLGRSRVYWAKIAAGISFAVGSAVLLSLFAFILTLCLHGGDGFQAAFQMIYAGSSEPLTCGQAVLIAFGCMIAAAVVTSIFVMLLSELLHSNVAALAVSAGLLILPMMIAVPEQYRIPAQVWDWLPWCFLTPWNVFGRYTISLSGHYLTAWQAAPVLYLAAGAVTAAVGKAVYQRFQVRGR